MVTLSPNDIEFDDLVGSPKFSNHTHSEGGLATIPNTGLTNTDITVNGNSGISGGTASLGSSLSIDISGELTLDANLAAVDGELIWDESNDYIPIDRLQNDSISFSAGDGVSSDSSVQLGDTVNISVNPSDFAGSFISTSGTPSDLDVQIGLGLEGDGSGNIRAAGDSIADGFVSEGTNAHQISVNITSGLEGDGSNNIRVSGDSIAGNVLSEGTNPHEVEVNIGDGLTQSTSNLVVDSSDFISVGSNGVSVNIGTGLESDGSDNIRPRGDEIADGFLSEGSSAYQLSVNTTNGLEGDGSNNIRVDASDLAGNVLSQTANPYELDVNIGNGLASSTGDLVAEASTYITVSSGGISANIGNGLEGDGTDNIRVSGDSIADSFLSEGTNAYQLSVNISTGLTSDGSNNIEVDETFSPAWSSSHTFNAGITMGDAINMQSSHLITNLPSPSDIDDAARKGYVDSVAQGLNLKRDVEAATDGNDIDLSSATNPNPIDGTTVSDNDRVLLKDQNDAVENGIYVAQTATDPTTWVRSEDFDEDGDVTSGSFTFVDNGTNNADTSFIVVTDDPIDVGVDNIVWSQFASAGEILGGDGLIKSGQTLDINVSDFAGSGLQDDGSDNIELTNNSITLNGGNGLKNGSNALLGGSFSLDIEPADFAGSFASDDGSDNLQVNITNGLEGDGSNNIRVSASDVAAGFLSEGANPYQLSVNIGTGLTGDGSGNIIVDEDTDFTFTSTIDFNNGLAMSGDGIKAFYGTNLIMSTRYDSVDDDLKWRDEANSTDRMALDRTTGDLTIGGTLDETSSP